MVVSKRPSSPPAGADSSRNVWIKLSARCACRVMVHKGKLSYGLSMPFIIGGVSSQQNSKNTPRRNCRQKMQQAETLLPGQPDYIT